MKRLFLLVLCLFLVTNNIRAENGNTPIMPPSPDDSQSGIDNRWNGSLPPDMVDGKAQEQLPEMGDAKHILEEAPNKELKEELIQNVKEPFYKEEGRIKRLYLILGSIILLILVILFGLYSETEKKFCSNCGKKIRSLSEFCEHCGKKV